MTSGHGFAIEFELPIAQPPEATETGTHARFVDRVWPTSLAGRVLVALSGTIMRRDLRARADRLRRMLEEGAARSSSR